MNLFEKIEKIQFDYGINASEFIEKTRLSRNLYYDIKDGSKTSLKPNQLKKIVDAFPESARLFIENSKQNGIISNNSETIKSDLTDLEVKEIVYKVATNEERFMQEKVFSNIIEIRVAKRLQKIMSSEEEYIKWRNN